MKKKIIICYSNYSSASLSVANNIKNALDNSKYEVKSIDINDYANKLNIFSNALFKETNRIKFLSGFLYKIINNKLVSTINEQYAIMCFDCNKLRKEFSKFKPDLIITTHFYSSFIATFYNKIDIIKSKVLTIVTDYTSHKFWSANHKDVNVYIVSNNVIKNDYVKSGVNSKKIYSYGLPHKEEFDLEDKIEVRNKYSIKDNKPLYCFFAGGDTGNSYTYEYFKILVNKNYDINIIFACGKNKALKLKCEEYIHKKNIKNVLVLGFTKDIYNLINISDIVITKPGSNAINDAILLKKPTILLPPTNSSEKFNAKYMLKNHFSLKGYTPIQLTKKVKLTLNYNFITKTITNKLNKIDTNNSLKKTIDLIKKMTK